ncbi:MAG: RNA 2',3'-cyclic phosphodiesterase [Candidatus Omnitrophica bacterium]|nr:RNA 2',3'-cyclic phosphodiesterase [Candidatus Omnitrophota bacterium]
MRTFIAIAFPETIRDYLKEVLERLKATGADVKWVSPENIHLTLKFLGEVDAEKTEKIALIMETIAKDTPCFRMSLSSLGAFPKIDYPRVIWMGVDKGGKECKEIAMVLEDKIAKLGITRQDRPFSSHITVGRLRSYTHRERLIQELRNPTIPATGKNPEFSVGQITLFKSTLTPAGPIYEPLKTVNLKAA